MSALAQLASRCAATPARSPSTRTQNGSSDATPSSLTPAATVASADRTTAAAGEAGAAAGTGTTTGSATLSPKTSMNRSAAASGLNVALGVAPASRAHGPARLLLVRELGHLRSHLVTIGRGRRRARRHGCSGSRPPSCRAGGRRRWPGPAQRYVSTFEGTENRDASGSRMATRTSALAMTSGQVLVGLEVEQHEVVGQLSPGASSARATRGPCPRRSRRPWRRGATRAAGRLMRARTLGSCLRPSVPEYSTTGWPVRPIRRLQALSAWRTGSSSMGAQFGTTVARSATPQRGQPLEERRRDRHHRVTASGHRALEAVGEHAPRRAR